MVIDTVIKNHNIKNLYHFTNVENLENIFKYGLLSIEKLQEKNIEYTSNEMMRLNKYRDRIFLSIGFPNYKAFHNLRSVSKAQWCIIQLSSKVLLEKDCLFYLKETVLQMGNKNEDDKKGSCTLSKLFYESIPSRITRGLLPEYTTNPTSIVMVRDFIELKYFKGIYFNNRKLYDKFKVKTRDINIIYDDKYFKKRVDWQYWKEKVLVVDN